jgi:hypothetical protein
MLIRATIANQKIQNQQPKTNPKPTPSDSLLCPKPKLEKTHSTKILQALPGNPVQGRCILGRSGEKESLIC